MTAGVVAIAVAGCGGSASSQSGDVANVKQTIVRELAALANGDGAAACSLATASGRAQVEKAVPGSSCEQVVTIVAQHLPQSVKQGMLSAHVNRVSINGETATVQDADITSSQGSLKPFLTPGSAPTKLVKQSDGSWKISG